LITDAVKTGVHRDVEHSRTVIGRRSGAKVALNTRILTTMFSDIWERSRPISWLDIGAGYGEFIEAVSALAHPDSDIMGLEPMKPKAADAKSRGLNVRELYLNDIKRQYEFLSLINVFSHIPEFRAFLDDVKNVLTPGGEFFIETGNIADLRGSHEVPGELNLPDHLVFAGEQNIKDYLQAAGFSIVAVKKRRVDGVIRFGKNIVKKGLGRNLTLRLPYTSRYRTMLVRAKLR
jgi:2-polyprenyl-3-methyl-5-hydroxy-6-metoxy-1,4-benzoquinol methylase